MANKKSKTTKKAVTKRKVSRKAEHSYVLYLLLLSVLAVATILVLFDENM